VNTTDIVGKPVWFLWNNLATRTAQPGEIGVEPHINTANSQEPTCPWSNLFNPLKTKVGRSQGLTDVVIIDIDLGSIYNAVQYANPSENRHIDTVVLYHHNLTLGVATASILGSGFVDFSSIHTNTVATVGENVLFIHFNQTNSARYWRILISDSNNVHGYVEASYVFIGEATEFDFPDFGEMVRPVDPSVRRYAYGGAVSHFKKDQYRLVDIPLSPMQQVDRRKLEEIYSYVGISEPLLVVLDPWNLKDNEDASAGQDGIHRLTMLGYFTSALGVGSLSQDWIQPQKLTFEEVRQ
jgi:hypothetical protein